MLLKNGVIRPGTVIQVLGNGQIKAAAPGLFSECDDANLLPPIMPWFIGNNSNAYSQPDIYDPVWILNFSDNPLQLYWFRREDSEVNLKSVPIGGKNVEVLCNKNVGNEYASLYFTDGTGWVISKGGSMIKINIDGSISLSANSAKGIIEVNDQGVSLGAYEKATHNVAYGDKIEVILTDLCMMLNGIGMKALGNPHTAAIGTDLLNKLPGITEQISDISSHYVTTE